GFLLGYIAFRMLKSVDNYQVEILITLSLVMGGYALASAIHTSGPIAIVVAGLLIGNHGRSLAMSDNTRKHLDTFWELLDEILNAVLFVLIGLEVLLLSFTQAFLFAGLLTIPLVLMSRWISVLLPVKILSRWRSFTPGAISVMTWGGIRGGISVALALSLPSTRPERELILAVTYMVVIFSIVVQGLLLNVLVRRTVIDR
ncbi:MAG: cation:proton antiporter, partial [bacterium]